MQFSQENGIVILPEAVEYAPYHQLRMLNSAKNLKIKRFQNGIPFLSAMVSVYLIVGRRK